MAGQWCQGEKVHFLRISVSSVPCGIRDSNICSKLKGCKLASVKDTKVYPGMELQLKSFLICIQTEVIEQDHTQADLPQGKFFPLNWIVFGPQSSLEVLENGKF